MAVRVTARRITMLRIEQLSKRYPNGTLALRDAFETSFFHKL